MNLSNLSAVDLWGLVSSIVTVASIIVQLTPGKGDDEIIGRARRFIEFLAMNKRK